MNRWYLFLILVALAGASALSIQRMENSGSTTRGPEENSASVDVLDELFHVGSGRCADCHPQEHLSWRDSHHELAMATPTNRTLRGDFSGATFNHGGESSRFVRRDGSPWIEIAQQDRTLAYPVHSTFGVSPLQQFLIEIGGGRLQAYTVAWATEEADGGACWYPLYPDEEPKPGDPFHWSGYLFNWNSMCAECHSTALTKGYDRETDQYSTTWKELSVGCEACHGPGSAHVSWAESLNEQNTDPHPPARGFPVNLKRDQVTRWVRSEGAATARREPGVSEEVELDVCGRCHSRRSPLTDSVVPGSSLHETHRVELLSQDLYYPDGQIFDEVYVYGSFLQSRMHAAGVTCSDCHDPHSGHLRNEGNALCSGCHDPVVFDTKKHHRHSALGGVGSGTSCVDCHMPSRTYMGVDPRRDHSFRIPRPDLSLKFSVPNACNNCHQDKSVRWAADQVAMWFPDGRTAKPHFVEALVTGRSGSAKGGRALTDLVLDLDQPAIVRATALSELVGRVDATSLKAITVSLADRNPLVRRAALVAGEGLPFEIFGDHAAMRLDDSMKSVRIEAARWLAPYHPRLKDSATRERLSSALSEYRSAQEFQSDRPEGLMNLAALALAEGNYVEAEKEYRAALSLAPFFGSAGVNLADLLRVQGRNQEAIKILEEVIKYSPEDAGVHHALGLAYVRAKQRGRAMPSLRQAADLAPEVSRYVYVLAIALRDSGDADAAVAAIDAGLKARPEAEILLKLKRQFR